MLKYRGTYRVTCEIDIQGKPQEFSCIPCKIHKGSNICRHDADTLNVYIIGKQAMSKLMEFPDIFTPYQAGDSEGTFLFPERLLPEAAFILKPYTKGSNISPRSKRNIKYSKKPQEKSMF